MEGKKKKRWGVCVERWIQEYKNNTELPSGVKTRKGDTILALKNLKKSFFCFL